MLMGRIFLFWRELTDPAFNFRGKPACSDKRDCRLNPAVMRHRKRLYSLAAGSIRRARASAPVGERNRANSSCIRAVAVSIRIGIDDGEHVRMLIGNVGIVASATLDAPVHSMRASWRGNIFDHL